MGPDKRSPTPQNQSESIKMSPSPKSTQHFQNFKSHFSKTLKSLCGTKGSINMVCQGLGINRQQFAKYLSGSTLPSIYAVQRMAEYFEVEASIFFAPTTSLRAPPVVSVAKTPDVTPGFYLEYSGVTFGNNEALLVSAWKFYKSGTKIMCHGEVPATALQIDFVSYRGEIKTLGSALALSATATRNKGSGIWAVMSPFEAGPTDYKAISLRGASAGKAQTIGSVSLFKYIGNAPDIVELVSSRCGTFQKEQFDAKMSQIWALLVQQASAREATIVLAM